jgi:hypothetical protein
MKNLRKISDQKLPATKSKKEILLSITRKLFPVILGLIGVGIILLATSRFNAGVSPDSVLYIATARNIANGNGITSWDGSPMVAGAPLYPIVLAIVSYVFKIDPLFSARFVNALLFGLIIYLSGILFKRHLKSSLAFVFLGTVSVLFSFSLVDVSLKVWTEPLFICFVLLYLIFSEIYVEKRNITSLVLIALTISLATLTRKIGFPLVFTSIIYILFFNRDTLAIKIRHFLLFGSVSVLPVTAALIRNYIFSGFLFGSNYSPVGKTTLYEVLKGTYHVANSMFDTIFSWYLPGLLHDSQPLLVVLGLAIGFIIGLEYMQNWMKLSNLRQVFPMLLSITAYTGALLLIEGPANYFDPRYLSPIFIPVTLLLLILSEKLLKPLLGRLSSKHVNGLFIAVLAIWFIYPTYETIHLTSNQMEKGSGYTSEIWNNSETIHYLLQQRTLESMCTIYTNGEDVIYFLAGLQTKQSPRNNLRGDGFTDISQLKGLWPQESKICLVWFDNITWRTYLFPPDELMSIVSFDEITRFQDGAIYVYLRK